MKYTLNSGESAQIKYTFPDLDPKPGYPTVSILDENDRVVSTFPTVQTQSPGEWASTVTIPDIDSSDISLYSAKWIIIDQKSNEHVIQIPIVVHPSTNVQSGDIVVMAGSDSFQFTLPVVLNTPGDCSITVYKNNDEAFPVADASAITAQVSSTFVTYEGTIPAASLAPYLISIQYITGSNMQQAIFNLWVVTPRMMIASMAIESAINKARIQQTIPQLDYTQADLLSYLERGLNLFNSYQPALTGFTGTNMQGVLYELWLLCSTYYALGAQTLAEGMLAFDFGGQAVTLSVDRTGPLESALGRIESQMSERIPPAKTMMAKYGIRGGSGSNGTMQGLNPVSLGYAGITNAPTTQNVPGMYGSQVRRYR